MEFFHSIIKWIRVRNGFNGLLINYQCCDEPGVVKEKVKEFLKNRFSREDGLQIKLLKVEISRGSNARIMIC